MPDVRRVAITSAVRTATGSFMGGLFGVPATVLGGIVLAEVVRRIGLPMNLVTYVMMGNVLQALLGQNPARVAVGAGGFDLKLTDAETVNKVCNSALIAIMRACQAIALGEHDIMCAGGMENMSRAPHAEQRRLLKKYGSAILLDTLEHDGLSSAFPYQNVEHASMGVFADLLARQNGISRADQDEETRIVFRQVLAAIAAGKFEDEIVKVMIPGGKGAPTSFDTDEEPARGNMAKIPTLKPAFGKDGTVTAASSSPMSDAASAVCLMAEEVAKAHGIKCRAIIRSMATHPVAPEIFPDGTIYASELALERAGLKMSDMDLVEVNEAFAAVKIRYMRHFKLTHADDKVNVNGGAVAIGHAIGASGARIVVTLLHELERRNKQFGLATLCNGGGGGAAIVIERVAA